MTKNPLSDWLGLAIVTIVTLCAFVIGQLVFDGRITSQEAFTFISWCVLPWLAGIALHLRAVFRRRKKRLADTTGPSGEPLN